MSSKYLNFKIPQVFISKTYNGLKDWAIEVGAPAIDIAGSFSYYLEYQNSDKKLVRTSPRTFNVEPIIKLNDTIIPSNALVIQTYITKLLGPLERWSSVLKTSSDTNYNLIHFTPIQQLGESNSSYSLYEQLSISDGLFPNEKLDQPTKEKRLQEILQSLREQHRIMSMSDVVWNHTVSFIFFYHLTQKANNSPWLRDHPESGYNLENSPHLRVAFELDETLLHFSDDFIRGKVFQDPHFRNHSGSTESG
jgi:glycogen debranching enzyme